MYKILAGEQTIYDSTNKYGLPVIEPVLNLELGEAGNLEFTVLPGHPLINELHEMQTFVTVFQDDEEIFYGRVLQADEDIYGQLKVSCEGALTFLLDSEMEPETYTETISAFFARVIQAHNDQVEAAKQFAVGEIRHEEADKQLEFKLEGYNQTRQVLDNLLIDKHGGHLHVRYQNGTRYLDYIQYFDSVSNQPIKIGYNIIDRQKHVSGENVFTILRPLGKNNVTIEGASSVNLLGTPNLVQGKYLKEGGAGQADEDADWMHSPNLISVTPGQDYLYGPGEMWITYFDRDEVCMTTEALTDSFVMTIPTEIEGFENPPAKIMLTYAKEYDGKVTFLPAGGTSVLGTSGIEEGKILAYVGPDIENPTNDTVTAYDLWTDYDETSEDDVIIEREKEVAVSGWNYDPNYISVSAGATYLAIPGSISVTFYESDGEGGYDCISIWKPEDDIGCDIFEVPVGAVKMRLSYPNRFADTMKVLPYSNENLAERDAGVAGKFEYVKSDKEETDAAWCYNSNYIEVEEDTYYTGGPSPIKVCWYDKDKHYISFSEANRTGMTMHYVKAPINAVFMRISYLAEYASEQQLQKGKALILTKLDPGTKTILLPERIAKYGQIIHSESFGDISDPQELYNAAIEWVSLHHSMLPASMDISIVDFHHLNPQINRFELGDVYENIEGFEDEAVTISTVSKDLENPANDSITLRNIADLTGSDAGKSSGSLSSKYASGGGGGGGSGSGGALYPHIRDEEDGSLFSVSEVKEIALRAMEYLHLDAPRIRLMAEETDKLKARIDLIAKGKDGNQSTISLTDTTAAINAQNIILQATNLYNIADNVVTIADQVHTHANLIWNEAKDIVTIADNMYILTDNLTVVADKIKIIANDIDILARNINIVAEKFSLQAEQINLTAGKVETLENGHKLIFGSSLNLTSNQAALANGILYLDEDGYLHIRYGSGIRMNGPNETDWGVYLHDVIQAGGLIKRINDTAGESLDARFGTYTAGLLDAGVLVQRLTDDQGQSWAADFGTYVNGKLDAGLMVTKLVDLNESGDPTLTTYKTKLGTLVRGQLDAGFLVEKITGNTSDTSYAVKLGTYVGENLDAGVLVTKITGNNDANTTTAVKLGTYVGENLDAGVLVTKITGNNDANTSTAVKLGTYVGENLDAGVLVTKITGDTSDNEVAVKMGTFIGDNLTGGMIVEKLTGQTPGQDKTALRLLGDNIDISANDSITSKVGRSEIGIDGDSITIKGDTIDLSGYVKANEIETYILDVTQGYGHSFELGSLDVGGSTQTDSLSVSGEASITYLSVGDININGLALGSVGETLGNAFTSVTGEFSNGSLTLIFGTLGGGSESAGPFDLSATTWFQNQIAAAEASALTGVALDVGSWNNGGRTIQVLNNGIAFITNGAVSIPDPEDYTDIKLTNSLISTSFSVGGKPFTHNIDISSYGIFDAGYAAALDNIQNTGYVADIWGSGNGYYFGQFTIRDSSTGQGIKTIQIAFPDRGIGSGSGSGSGNNVSLNDISLSTGTWSNGGRTVQVLHNGTAFITNTSVTIPDPTNYTQVKISNTLIGLSFSVGGKPFSHNIDLSSYGSLGGSGSGSGSGVSLNDITLNTGSWSNGGRTITVVHNGTAFITNNSVTIPNPTNYVTSKISDTMVGLSFSVGGKPFSHNIDLSSYGSLGSSGSGSGISLNDITLNTGTWSNGGRTVQVLHNGTAFITNAGITIPNATDYSVSKIADKTLSISFKVGGKSFTYSQINADSVYEAGWVAGYNAAAQVSGRNGNTVTVPTTTSSYESEPTTTYTAKADSTADTHRIEFPSAISLVPGQVFQGAAGNYVYKNSVVLKGYEPVTVITWS